MRTKMGKYRSFKAITVLLKHAGNTEERIQRDAVRATVMGIQYSQFVS